MAARNGSEPTQKNQTSLERSSDREIVVARTFNGPARIVFDAWTRPELVKRWWAPVALGASIVACDADVRVGGSYRSGSLGTAVVPTLAGQGAGAWIRDPCRALPQIEVCERRRGRRDALRRRFTIAQPSERALLGSEERSINARLGQDCR